MRQTARKFHTRLVALFVALLLLSPMAPVVRAVSGDCGDGVTWEMTGSVLTVSGKGKMDDYTEEKPAPWSGMGITTVHIGPGVESVGALAFFQMEEITAVTLADSVKFVGNYAFYECKGLTLLELGQGVETIGDSAFEQCVSLMALRLPKSLQVMGQQAFYCCESLQTVTVPESVTQMGNAVFAHCTALKMAMVNAQVKALPVWAFYGCAALESVLLNPAIAETGAEAFAGCAMTDPPARGSLDVGGSLTHTSSTQDSQGNTITQEYLQSGNSDISTQTGSDGKTTMDAVLENNTGWDELNKELEDITDSGQVNVHIKGDVTVSSNTLHQIVGKDIAVNIQSSNGDKWIIKGKDLPLTGLQEHYDLSFTIRQLTKRNSKQKEIFGESTVFAVIFDGEINFKTEVLLPLDGDLARHSAAFYAPEKGSYNCLQNVLIDDSGRAHFYLQQVKAGVEYLIGIDVPEQKDNTPVVPEPLHQDYGVDQKEEVEYIVLGPKSSWGLDISQVTWILVAVMVGSVIVVGVVVGIMNKRRLKKGYIPDYDDEEETQE